MEFLTIDELRATEAYKKRGLIFPHPKDLVEVFFKPITKEYPTAIHNVSIKVDKEGGAGVKDDNGRENLVTWGRGVITVNVLDIHSEHGNYTIGLTWSYDTSKCVIKVFAGINATACTNLSIFQADDIQEFTLGTAFKPKNDRDKAKIWSRKIEDVMDNVSFTTAEFVKGAQEIFDRGNSFIGRLKAHYITGETGVASFIGTLYIDEVMNGGFDSYTFDYGCRMLFDPMFDHENRTLYCDINSFNKPDDLIFETEGSSHRAQIRLIDLYGAFTQRLTDGRVEVDWLPNKTLEVGDLFVRYFEKIDAVQEAL